MHLLYFRINLLGHEHVYACTLESATPSLQAHARCPALEVTVVGAPADAAHHAIPDLPIMYGWGALYSLPTSPVPQEKAEQWALACRIRKPFEVTPEYLRALEWSEQHIAYAQQIVAIAPNASQSLIDRCIYRLDRGCSDKQLRAYIAKELEDDDGLPF